MSKIYDLIWKKGEYEGKAQWERVGILLEKEDGKRSMKLDLETYIITYEFPASVPFLESN